MLRSMRESAKSPIMKIFLFFLPLGSPYGGSEICQAVSSHQATKQLAGEHSVSATEAAAEFERTRITAVRVHQLAKHFKRAC